VTSTHAPTRVGGGSCVGVSLLHVHCLHTLPSLSWHDSHRRPQPSSILYSPHKYVPGMAEFYDTVSYADRLNETLGRLTALQNKVTKQEKTIQHKEDQLHKHKKDYQRLQSKYDDLYQEHKLLECKFDQVCRENNKPQCRPEGASSQRRAEEGENQGTSTSPRTCSCGRGGTLRQCALNTRNIAMRNKTFKTL